MYRMRFPLRLTADLALGLVARAMKPARNHPLILNLGDAGKFDAPSARSPQARGVSALPRSPIVWIAGAEPFAHPEIARFSSALLAEKRHLFLEVAPGLARRRIHEFRPVSRLHLTFRFDGFAKRHGRPSAIEGANEQALAAIRGVKLSGFLVCAHIVVHAGTSLEELVQLRGRLHKHDVDGYVITAGAATSDVQQRVQQARRALLSRRWALFSELLGSVAPPARSIEPSATARKTRGRAEAAECEAQWEEGAQA